MNIDITTPINQGSEPVPGDPEFYDSELPSFTKKVEILRALELTEKQFNKEYGSIRRLPFCENKGEKSNIKAIDLQLMEEFKKVYSLGTKQLTKFITGLDEAAPAEAGGGDENKLDEYSILYYISLLEHGPYEQETHEATGRSKGLDKITVEIFRPGPDIMGVNANSNVTTSSAPVWVNALQAGNTMVPNDTLRKAPGFLTNLMFQGAGNASGVFAGAVLGSGAIDENTAPYPSLLHGMMQMDKNNDDRKEQEAGVPQKASGDAPEEEEVDPGIPAGAVVEPGSGRNKVNPVHGNLMVKDIEKIKIHEDVQDRIIELINEYLGDKAFRLFLFRKLINYFNEYQNLAHSVGASINRNVDYMQQTFLEDEEDDCFNCNKPEILTKATKKVETDMFGRTFDSVERRKFELKTKDNNGENKFKLYTVKGQLGSGVDVEEDGGMFGNE